MGNTLRKYLKNGFTLPELLLAVAILAFALGCLLLVFINSLLLNETNRGIALAFAAVQTRMEQIKNTSFGTLDSLNGTTFDLNGFPAGTGSARVEVTNEASRLKRVRIAACFMVRNRLIGDNLANCQVSPVELVTLIAE